MERFCCYSQERMKRERQISLTKQVVFFKFYSVYMTMNKFSSNVEIKPITYDDFINTFFRVVIYSYVDYLYKKVGSRSVTTTKESI